MSTPSPSPSPPPPESASHSPPSNPRSLTKRPHPVPWSPQETIHLIQSYQQKWYSLKRGQLKANQWQEVAAAVAARCGYGYNHPPKTVIQCRHKMEKLRKRFREEKRRMSFTGSCFWQFYDLMESLERGPMPISTRPMAEEIDQDAEGEDEFEEEEVEEEEEQDEYECRNKSRSINHILRKPTVVNRFADSGFGEGAVEKRKREETAEEEEMEVRIAGEIKAFTERIVGMERKKMEVMKETEKWRMEMENKRIEMILDSQRKIVVLHTEDSVQYTKRKWARS
ncbi:Homeodomain-like superfamily protein [Euphorbia peplus]|nr:Homeodomain-like superfamily protein [Euphorbia peplus]